MDTRAAILDNAQTLVQTRGVNGMSYDDISRAVGIRKASIHYHFPTKTDLVVALVERYTEAFLVQADTLLISSASALEKLRGYVDLFAATLRQDDAPLCLCGMLASELQTLDPEIQLRVRVFYDENTRRLAALMRAGITDGTLSIPGDPDATAAMVFSLLEGAMMTARLAGGAERFHGMAEQLYALLGQATN